MGVYATGNTFQATAYRDGKKLYLGAFVSEADAIAAYEKVRNTPGYELARRIANRKRGLAGRGAYGQGVYRNKRGRYHSRIMVGGRSYELGQYADIENARHRYKQALTAFIKGGESGFIEWYEHFRAYLRKTGHKLRKADGGIGSDGSAGGSAGGDSGRGRSDGSGGDGSGVGSTHAA